MHPLVQLATKRWLEIHGKIKQRKEAFDLLSHKLPNGEYENRPVWEALEPHINMVLCYDCVSSCFKLRRAGILHNNAWFALARGNYETTLRRAHFIGSR